MSGHNVDTKWQTARRLTVLGAKTPPAVAGQNRQFVTLARADEVLE
jgi:hypothetical protein